VLGEPVDLPWADNVTYLWWDGGLLMPTTSACHPSADLVRAALLPRLPQHRDLIVLLDGDVLATAPLVRLADPAKLRAMR
jgi:hypothetical protein